MRIHPFQRMAGSTFLLYDLSAHVYIDPYQPSPF
ncbi:MAG: hypothetical protein F9K48_08085 [Candidatus Brocadia sp.]|nr:MAG: hypothetical protein F9K48_08085 [Candidatus Brocadia sp.]